MTVDPQQALRLKTGYADMLRGGVIMDVVNSDQAKIAEEAGAVAVMALERVPADIRRDGGVARMASIEVIDSIMQSVTIPVMALTAFVFIIVLLCYHVAYHRSV